MPTEIPARWQPIWDTGPLDVAPEPALDSIQGQAEARPYPPAHGQRYLLPCPVLFYSGIYQYVVIDAPQARRWALSGPLTSYLTHPMIHAAFAQLMGFVTPPAQRGRLPQLGYHDDALIFQIDGYETLPDLRRGDSRKIQELVEADHYTLAFLKQVR